MFGLRAHINHLSILPIRTQLAVILWLLSDAGQIFYPEQWIRAFDLSHRHRPYIKVYVGSTHL